VVPGLVYAVSVAVLCCTVACGCRCVALFLVVCMVFVCWLCGASVSVWVSLFLVVFVIVWVSVWLLVLVLVFGLGIGLVLGFWSWVCFWFWTCFWFRV